MAFSKKRFNTNLLQQAGPVIQEEPTKQALQQSVQPLQQAGQVGSKKISLNFGEVDFSKLEKIKDTSEKKIEKDYNKERQKILALLEKQFNLK